MFPSIENNPFSQFPQHLYISSSSFGQINGNFINETFFHNHQHQNQILNQIFGDGNKQENGVPNNLLGGPTKVELVGENMNEYGEKYQYAPLDIIPARLFQPPPEKKDRPRHSKIVTAQGPRDRRVRLSIDIAKKFFGLQEMLGYDKASKTLDWLLTNSKIAIEEVAQSKKKNTHMTNYPSGSDVSGHGKRSKKESNRVKERERAKERTRRKKMCILADHKQSYHTTISPSTLISSGKEISVVDFDMNSQVYSKLFPQLSSYKELSEIKKKGFITTSSMYDGPSKNSCPQDHFFPCTSTANWDTYNYPKSVPTMWTNKLGHDEYKSSGLATMKRMEEY